MVGESGLCFVSAQRDSFETLTLFPEISEWASCLFFLVLYNITHKIISYDIIWPIISLKKKTGKACGTKSQKDLIIISLVAPISVFGVRIWLIFPACNLIN